MGALKCSGSRSARPRSTLPQHDSKIAGACGREGRVMGKDVNPLKHGRFQVADCWAARTLHKLVRHATKPCKAQHRLLSNSMESPYTATASWQYHPRVVLCTTSSSTTTNPKGVTGRKTYSCSPTRPPTIEWEAMSRRAMASEEHTRRAGNNYRAAADSCPAPSKSEAGAVYEGFELY